VASGAVTADTAESVTARLRLNSAARHRLRSQRTLRMAVQVSFPGAFGQSRTVVLQLPKQSRSGKSNDRQA
jgi:hypothetical protein